MATIITLFIPDELEHVADDIRRFMDAMLYKLRKNSKKSKPGEKWLDEPMGKRFGKLEAELNELRDAISERNSVEVLLEASDVANYALIIANSALEKPNEHDTTEVTT